MKEETNLKAGDKVKVERGSCQCNMCLKFFKTHPNGIGFITSINESTNDVSVDHVSFSKEIITKVDNKNKKENDQNQIVIGLKPITIKSLDQAGACFNKLKEFVVIVQEKKLDYLWISIPPDYAQEVATQLGYPDWLEEHNFIRYEKKQIIHNIEIYEHHDCFIVKAKLKNGNGWYLFNIYKDGRGFSRHADISNIAEIEIEKNGMIKEVQYKREE